MDTLNRFLMRKSGELKHQPRTLSERMVFGFMDFLMEKKLLTGWETNNEEIKNHLLERFEENVSAMYREDKPVFTFDVTCKLFFLAEAAELVEKDPLKEFTLFREKMKFLQEITDHLQRCADPVMV